MKSYLKKIFNSPFSKIIRNTLQFKTIPIDFSQLSYSTSISDGFTWRTDNGFRTIFRFSDLLKFFYDKDETSVELKFYDKNYNLIKEVLIENLFLNNEIVIDSEYLDGKETYGIFYIFHRYKKKLDQTIILSNRCYLGFSRNRSLASFVHGNSHLASKTFNGDVYKNNFVSKSLFNNSRYKIQNNFEEFDKTELFFCNPNDSKLVFYLNGNEYRLDGYNSIIIDIKYEKIVEIKSNCNFFRPIIFNYKKNFFDVYHS